MTGGRESTHALIKSGEGDLWLSVTTGTSGGAPTGKAAMVEYLFGGGTTIENGTIRVQDRVTLRSNVSVEKAGHLDVVGFVIGNVVTKGEVFLWGTVTGNVRNDGVLTPGSSDSNIYQVAARIQGDYHQTSAGTIDVVLGSASGGYISVTGRADIDGSLRFVQHCYYNECYALPSTPISLKVLHADGGVFGQFDQWTSPGLFITGALRYLTNDVYFDASAVSAAKAMGVARAGDALTLAAAGHFDSALDHAVDFGKLPDSEQTQTQRDFLASVTRIQQLQDFGQAVKTFDSLSGHAYVDMANVLLQQSALPASGLINHIGSLHAGSAAGAWAAQSTMFATGASAFGERRSGFDQWLNDRLLIGFSLGVGDGSLRVDRSGGVARDNAPQWDLYLRRNGGRDSYVLGDFGYSHHQLDFNRGIDLGQNLQNVLSDRSADVQHAYVEAGQDFFTSAGRLTPFAAMSYATLHAGGAIEHGTTGFELITQPSFHARSYASAGLRFERNWRMGDGQWWRLNLAAGAMQQLSARDMANAAFTGTPDAAFALAGIANPQTSGWMQVNLGATGEKWSWLLSLDRQASAQALSMGMEYRF
ncbi:MAG: autotransporter domain-containing protein [Proteobacteria bacterium]|nr:autotransporter domain-containing protein [Pseudomonadota bacterium]